MSKVCSLMPQHSIVTLFRVLSFVCPAQLWHWGSCLEEASLYSWLVYLMFHTENTFFVAPLKPSCVCMADFESPLRGFSWPVLAPYGCRSYSV